MSRTARPWARHSRPAQTQPAPRSSMALTPGAGGEAASEAACNHPSLTDLDLGGELNNFEGPLSCVQQFRTMPLPISGK